MIPKVIHYCWFGGNPLTELAQKCIESWRKFCPDYEILCWDESNYDITKNQYMKEAYDEKKWGFVPDYARLDIIYNHGGIYMDTDVELLKPLDEFLTHEAFLAVERTGIVALGLGFGAAKGNDVILQLLKQYEGRTFLIDGKPDLTTAPTYQANFFKKYGIFEDKTYEIEPGCFVYSREYFNPTDLDTGKLLLTPNTKSIHHYAGSWTTPANRRNTIIYQHLTRYFGKNTAERVKKFKKKVCSLFKQK